MALFEFTVTDLNTGETFAVVQDTLEIDWNNS